MHHTMIEKIIGAHCGHEVKPDDIVELTIDTRVARDFGGANVVRHLIDNGLPVNDPGRTFFTFDCNPGGSDQKYATNQHFCRLYARRTGIGLFDIDQGIGTHLAIDRGLVLPGETFVSTDSHANILGAIGAFGQGMGDQDVAYAFAYGRTWFKVPRSVRLVLTGEPSPRTTAKDLVLMLLRQFGSSGFLGHAVEVTGPAVERLTLSDRITIASMATEMGAIILLFPPNERILAELPGRNGAIGTVFEADSGADYVAGHTVDLSSAEPLVARPGSPEDVVAVTEVAGRRIDSAFIGSCTNGRMEDLERVANLLDGRRIASHVVLKIVPATNQIWQQCLEKGLIARFKQAGALVGNAGCAGCAEGQIGQNGPGEVTVSSGNRNFPGKQGKGEVWLASPETVTASALAGVICTPATLELFLAGGEPAVMITESESDAPATAPATAAEKAGDAVAPGAAAKPELISGRVWLVEKDNIDTDMIFHNRHLTVTKLAEMGKYAFGNLKGWEDFSTRIKPGDLVVTGGNFGAGSSRQQAVDCFISLGVALIIARSFGAIYERNAINAGMPIMVADWSGLALQNGDNLTVNLRTGEIVNTTRGTTVVGTPFPDVQWEIYQRGGLLVRAGKE